MTCFVFEVNKYARRKFRSRSLLHSFWNGLEPELWPVLCFVINDKWTNQMMAIKSCWSWESNDPYNHEVVMVQLISFCCHFGVRLGGFWKHFGVMLRSKIVLEAPWTLHSSQTSISTPFPHQNSGHFGRFWKAFGEIFVIIWVSFVDIDFTMNF